ncbi:MAG: patatin-like phospholipase family protein [Rhodothermales bacterium]
MTSGQTQALGEIREIEAVAEDTLSVVAVDELTKPGGVLCLDLSLRTAELDRAPEGISLRARERFLVRVPADFPFAKPEVCTRHTRFAGRPHVQWARHLCLYQAPDVEWDPGDGMFGFVDRLWKWLEKAALDELDPVGGPLHPPTTYPGAGPRYYVVPRVDTPAVADSPWTGLARLNVVHEHRIDIDGWVDLFPDEPMGPAAATVLLAQPMPWEFPTRMTDLLEALAARGVSKHELLPLLQAAAWQNEEDAPLYVLVGTPMRGIRGSGDLKQHLTAWRIEPVFAKGLRLIATKYSDEERIREIGEEVERIMFDWADKADVSWCRVLEDRPEIVTRRDHASPMSTFRGQTVAVWGCGALGGHIALNLVRAGVARIILRDSAIVTPGVLVRQPYDDADIGTPKTEALAAKLHAVRSVGPSFKVVPLVSNVLSTALASDDWTDDADVVFDCTASRGVRTKLEKVRKDNLQARATVVSMIINREATHGLTVVATADHSGGAADVYRRAKIDVCRNRSLRHFADAFYPAPSDDDLFQPEPGCSSPTFVGSSADASALSALLLNAVAANLYRQQDRTHAEVTAEGAGPAAWAHFVVQPHAVPLDACHKPSVSFAYSPDIVTEDTRRCYEIRTSARAWEQMLRWIARSRDTVGPDVETGGLSFGERNDTIGVIWVTEVTGPPPDSIARPDLFVCGIVGTQTAHLERERWSRGSVRYVGMWHTHPVTAPVTSPTDLGGMAKILADGEVNPSRALLSIIGTPYDAPEIGTYVFDRDDVRTSRRQTYRSVRVVPVESPSRHPNVGLALSGGGSRAIAFHLGCLRALHARGVLDKVGVVSAVSGGAVLAAMYAYSDDDFDAFDARVCALLRRGLQLDIAKATFSPLHLARSAATFLIAGTAAKGAQLTRGTLAAGHGLLNRSNRATRSSSLSRIAPPFRRWASRTTAFETVLRNRLFGDAIVREPRRAGLDVVLNATELRTGTAFRFGSRACACSRFGSVQEDILVATAVCASAAYPAFLPALHNRYTFEQNGKTRAERVVLTDGGVYDNLGASCLDPSRDPDYTAHVYPCDRLICCNAGHGQWDGFITPYGWPSRMQRTVEAMFRKGQDRTMGQLFAQRASGDLEVLILPYLGMKDEALHRDADVGPLPDDFVVQNQVIGYPTDFRAMSESDLDRLSGRGEQLTYLLTDAYWIDSR